MIEIKNVDGAVVFSGEYEGVKDAVEAAVKNKVGLRGANLQGVDLSGADLSEANLSEAYLQGVNLYRANLFKADLRGADLSGASLYRANLSEANLKGANLEGASLYRANLSGVNLEEANTTSNSPENKECAVKGKRPRTKNVSTASLTNRKKVQLRPIPEPSIAGAKMKEEDKEVKLYDVDGDILFTGRGSCKEVLKLALESECLLTGISMKGEDLRGIVVRRYEMNEANFSGADLRGASFIKVDLQLATFEGAKLQGVEFIDCDLRDANLETNLTDVRISGCKTEGALTLKGVYNSLDHLNLVGPSKKPSIENPAVVEQAEKPKLTVETSILVSFSSLKRKLRVSEEQLQRARDICLKAQGKKRENEVIELVFDPEGVYIPVFLVGRKNAYVLDFQGRISAVIDKGDELTFAVLTALKIFPIAMSKNKVGTNLTSKHGNEMDFQVGQEMFFDDDVHADI